MKNLLIVLICLTSLRGSAQEKTNPLKFDPNKKTYSVLASCGTCNFKMKATGCPLAIKLDNKYYLVEGTGIDEHGDAHADDGFCNAVKKAKVQGAIEGDKFKVTYFELVEKSTKKE